MLTPAHVADAPRSVRHMMPRQSSEPTGALLNSLGPIEHEWHILVLGNGGLDLMCALLQAGAPKVTHLCSHERLEAESASLVIVPRASSLEWLEAALPRIRRALINNGCLSAFVDPLPATRSRVERMLKRHGLSALRAKRVAGRLLLTAEVPDFGLCRCA
jgi:hypothetical protein